MCNHIRQSRPPHAPALLGSAIALTQQRSERDDADLPFKEYAINPQQDTNSTKPGTRQTVRGSIAGEEDPGAAVGPPPSRPGDEAPAGTPGTG
jgi:hypothetical protein